MADACFDWARLAGHRRRRDGAEPAEWRQALAHLAGCDACRRAALAADPTLVFQLLPASEPAPDETARMRAAVAAMRRTAPLRRAARPVVPWRAAAAALLATVALAQAPAAKLARTAVAAAPAVELPSELSLQPIVEDTDRPSARVYQLTGQDLAVVMIVDETLDV